MRDASHEATAAERISLMLLDPDRRLLRIRAARGMDKALQGAVYCPVGRGLAGRAFALGRALAGRARTPVAGRYRAEAYAILPLGDGTRAVGVANLTSFREDELPDVPTLERWALLARLAGEALALAFRLERAEALTQTDALTGLPNRRAFEQALSRDVDRAARSGVQLAVALFDLDHFKRVNDELGHLVGDQALRHAAREPPRCCAEATSSPAGAGRSSRPSSRDSPEEARQRSRPWTAPGPGWPNARSTVAHGRPLPTDHRLLRARPLAHRRPGRPRPACGGGQGPLPGQGSGPEHGPPGLSPRLTAAGVDLPLRGRGNRAAQGRTSKQSMGPCRGFSPGTPWTAWTSSP